MENVSSRDPIRPERRAFPRRDTDPYSAQKRYSNLVTPVSDRERSEWFGESEARDHVLV